MAKRRGLGATKGGLEGTRRTRSGQLSKARSGKMGPAPGRFELSKGILK